MYIRRYYEAIEIRANRQYCCLDRFSMSAELNPDVD